MKSINHTDNHTFLTTGPIGPVILTMAIPTIISMLVTSLYNVVDTFYVGRIDTSATAAVGIVFPVMSIMQAIGFFFGQGSGTYISRSLGARKVEDAERMASAAFYCSLGAGMLLAAIGLVFLDPLSAALGSTPSILPYTKDFLGIILLGTPFVTASMTLNNQMRFQGNAAYSMLGILSGAVLNVVTVPIFTFTLGMGIKGAALGTLAGQVTGFLVLLAMTRHGGNIRLTPKNFTVERRFYIEILKGGTPSLSRQGLASIATLMLNLAAGAYGDSAIAGMSIVSRISFVVFSVIIGLGQGFQPMCGFNYGAGLYERVRKGYFFCLKSGMAFLAVICILGFVFSKEIVDFLRHDADVVSVGAEALRWQIITYPLAAVITVSNMALQTSGRAIPANILAACRNGIFFIPLIIILPRLLGLKGVEICQSIADIFSFAVAIPLMVSYFRSISGSFDGFSRKVAVLSVGKAGRK